MANKYDTLKSVYRERRRIQQNAEAFWTSLRAATPWRHDARDIQHHLQNVYSNGSLSGAYLEHNRVCHGWYPRIAELPSRKNIPDTFPRRAARELKTGRKERQQGHLCSSGNQMRGQERGFRTVARRHGGREILDTQSAQADNKIISLQCAAEPHEHSYGHTEPRR